MEAAGNVQMQVATHVITMFINAIIATMDMELLMVAVENVQTLIALHAMETPTNVGIVTMAME